MFEKDCCNFASGGMKILLDSNYEIFFIRPKSDLLSFEATNLSATSSKLTSHVQIRAIFSTSACQLEDGFLEHVNQS